MGHRPNARTPWRLTHVTLPMLASKARLAIARATHRHCTLRFDRPVYAGPGFYLDIPEGGTLIVGPGVQFRRNVMIEIHGEGRVTIGRNVIFTYGALIQCSTSIDIGDEVVIGWNSILVDGGHRFDDPDRHLLEQGYDFRPLTLANRSIVMTGCTIINSIGEGAIVGANSVVVDEVPARTLVAGSPAKVIRHIGDGSPNA